MRGVFKKIFYSSDLAAATAAVSVHGSRLTRSKMVLAQDESIAMGVGVKNVVLNSQGIMKKQARTLDIGADSKRVYLLRYGSGLSNAASAFLPRKASQMSGAWGGGLGNRN